MASNDSTVTIRLPADMIVDLDDIAHMDDISRSKLIRRVLVSYISRRLPTTAPIPKAQ